MRLYLKEISVSQDQLLENIAALTESEYFRQYNIGRNSRIATNRMETEFKAYDFSVPIKDITLGDIASTLRTLAKDIKDSGSHVEKVNIGIKPTLEMKMSYGFSEERAEEVGMELDFSAIAEKESDMMPLKIFNVGLREEKYSNPKMYQKEKKMYEAWRRDVRKELMKALPHF